MRIALLAAILAVILVMTTNTHAQLSNTIYVQSVQYSSGAPPTGQQIYGQTIVGFSCTTQGGQPRCFVASR
jgi:hypothetical protein